MNAKISLKKRIVSVILTVIMVFSMVPLSVFAANGGDNLTADERTALETLRETAKALLDRIADAKSNVEAKEITDVEDITEENVKSEDKDSLEDAKKALKDALRDFDGNYTDDERDDLEKKLETVNDAISAIENAAFFVFRRRLCLNRRVDNYF